MDECLHTGGQADTRELNWYPFYTRSRHEKKAYQNLIREGYNAYLPLKKSVRQWSDRRKIVETPLISSYVFAKTTRDQLYNIVKLDGIARYISFAGQPATIRDKEIDIIRKALTEDTELEVKDGMLGEGREVKLNAGPFMGYSGKVIKLKGKNRLVIEIEALNKTLLITVERNQLSGR